MWPVLFNGSRCLTVCFTFVFSEGIMASFLRLTEFQTFAVCIDGVGRTLAQDQFTAACVFFFKFDVAVLKGVQSRGQFTGARGVSSFHGSKGLAWRLVEEFLRSRLDYKYLQSLT